MILALTLAAHCFSPIGSSASPELFSNASHSLALPAVFGLDLEELAAKLAADQPAADRIAAAQGLAGRGKKASKIVPALILALNDTEPEVVDSIALTLQSIGKKAREPLEVVLASGEYEGVAMSQPAVIKTMLGMGGKATRLVTGHMDEMQMGSDKIQLMSDLGVTGLPYLAASFGEADGAFDLEMMRMLRSMAAKEPRNAESIEPALKAAKGADLKLALETSWLQYPDKASVEQYGAWVAGDDPVLIETGLWALGLLGKDGLGHAGAVAQQLNASDPTTRATAAWALTSFATPGPGPVVAEIPGSFPAASKKFTAKIEKAKETDVYVIWRQTAKALGYKGRIGTKARAFWGMAPTWTSTTLPVPETPDRAKISKELLSAEDRLFELASGESGLDARLASDALAAFGNKEDRCRDLWLQWLSTDDLPRVHSALVGLRAFGRDLIMMKPPAGPANEPLIAGHLAKSETMVPAAQLLTKIMTPTAWSAVVERMTQLEGKPPLEMILAISRYDLEALRPYLPQMQVLYEGGNYMFSAFLIKFGAEALGSFEKELSSKLMDRRMVAIESLGHIGKDARGLLPRLRQIQDKNPVIQKLVSDAVKRIQ